MGRSSPSLRSAYRSARRKCVGPQSSSLAIVLGVAGAALLIACQAIIGLDKFEKERDACTFQDCAVADVVVEASMDADYFGDASAVHRWVAWPMPNPADAETDANVANYAAPFEVGSGDGGKIMVVRDNITKLEWIRDVSAPRSFLDATTFCESLGNNFRLPTRIELVSLWDYTASTAFDTVFSGAAGEYWTQSPLPNKTSAWIVNFSNGGSVGSKSIAPQQQALVRCVR